jgi:hypothetical protein
MAIFMVGSPSPGVPVISLAGSMFDQDYFPID